MSGHDDDLLHIVSAWREMNWQSFRKAFDTLHAQAAAGGAGEEDVSRLRSRALRLLDWLGHCDVSARGGTDRIYAAPPVFARLPVAEAAQAVLCGARSPRTAEILRDMCRRRCQLHIERQSPEGESGHLPLRIVLEADTPAALAEVAREAGITCPESPPACGLVEFAGSLHEYLQSRPQTQAPEIDWPRRDYDVRALQFRPGERAEDVRLSVYEDPLRPVRLHRLWQGGAYREVERDWGRYALLRQTAIGVLAYDPRRLTLLVPSGAPLPRLLARACVLCSGRAPVFVRQAACSPVSQERFGFHVFRAVPPVVAQTVAQKLCQRLNITGLDALLAEESHD
jgi:hypothetical protein